MDRREELVEKLQKLHNEVDVQVGSLEKQLGDMLKCGKGCSECCIDDLTVFEIEAENIRKFHSDFLLGSDPAPEGVCAFQDANGACRIYEHRPYVCRTQGLPLRWMDYDDYDDLVEMRDICPVNDAEKSVLKLEQGQVWAIGPFEERLAKLQVELDGGKLNRIPLRSLFNKD